MKKIKCLILFFIVCFVSFFTLSLSANAATVRVSVMNVTTTGSTTIKLTEGELKACFNNLVENSVEYSNSGNIYDHQIQVYKIRTSISQFINCYVKPIEVVDARSNTISYRGLQDSIIKIYKIKTNIFGNYKSATEVDYDDDSSYCDSTGRGASCIFSCDSNTTYLVCVRGYSNYTGQYRIVFEMNRDRICQKVSQQKGFNIWTIKIDNPYSVPQESWYVNQIYYLDLDQTRNLYAVLLGFKESTENTGISINYFINSYSVRYNSLKKYNITLDRYTDEQLMEMVVGCLNLLQKCAIGSSYTESLDERRDNLIEYLENKCGIQKTYSVIKNSNGTSTLKLSFKFNKGLVLSKSILGSHANLSLDYGTWNAGSVATTLTGSEGYHGTWS